MYIDKFWKIFWMCFLLLALGLGVAIYALLDAQYHHVNDSGQEGERKVFAEEASQYQSAEANLRDPHFYRESLPLGSENWSWDTTIDWRSTQAVYSGAHAVRAEFKKSGAGVHVHTKKEGISRYSSLSMAVYGVVGLSNLYINLYDRSGALMQRQSIGWYFPEGTFTLGDWKEVSIPLENFGVAPGVDTLSGFSISSDEIGLAFFDDIRLTSATAPHARWYASSTAATSSPQEIFSSASSTGSTTAPLP